MKHIRFLGYGAIGLTFIAVGVAFVKPISTSNLFLRARATDSISYSQTISRATGSLVTRSNIYNYVSTKTSSGTTFYLRNVNDSSVSLGNNYVAVLPGSTDGPSKTPEITFTRGNSTASSETPFEFQNITSISVTSDTTSRTLDVFKSDDGDEWVSAGTMASSGGTNTNVDGAKYVKITYSGFYAAYINTITINYSCSNVPPEPKVLDSISVSGATTEYAVGDTFSFDGTVMASYTNPSLYPSVNVTSSAIVVEEPDMSVAAEDVEVVISYTEKGVTKEDSYFITIKEQSGPSSVDGVYLSAQTSGNTKYRSCLTLENNGTGTYVLEKWTSGGDYWTYTMNISYSDKDNNVTLTYVSLGKRIKYAGGPGGTATDYGVMTSLSTWFDPYRPFKGSSYISGSTSQIASLSSGTLTMLRYSASTDNTGSSLSLTKQ